MIKIELTAELKSFIQEKHEEWYENNILINLLETINILEALVDNSLNKYKIFFNEIKIKGKEFSTLDYNEIKEIIIRSNKLELNWREYNEKIKELNENVLLKEDFLKYFTSIKNEVKTYGIEKNSDKYFEYIENKIKELNKYTNITKEILEETLEIFSREKSISQKYYAKININKRLKKIESIFNYDLLYNEEEIENMKWDRHKILTILNVSVCPYCQRSYIGKYIDKSKEKTTADLDHFYSQSEFPFLAVCLYNFIPSCQICNSRMKLNKETYNKNLGEETIIHPHSNEVFTGVFSVEEKIINKLMGDEVFFKVYIKNSSKNKKVKNTIDMFKLDAVYENNHNKYIIDMLNNIINKPDTYLNSIAKLFTEEKYFNDERLKETLLNNLKEIVLEPYKFKIEKGEPLGKLTKDILEEFGIDI